MDDETRTGCTFATGMFLMVIVLILLGIGASIFGLWFNRRAMPYQEETRRRTYLNSQTHQEGSQANFEDLCLQWQQAKDQPSKDMLVGVIRQRKSVYAGPPLSDDVNSCFSRLGL